MTWGGFVYFAVAAISLSAAGAVCALAQRERSRWAQGLLLAAAAALGVFVAGLWISLGRPPLKTMGETRLWYSFFIAVAGAVTYSRWPYRWLPAVTATLGAVFSIVCLARPELHDTTLMPALQSVWFVPHVVVYMLGYSIFGCATALAAAGLWRGDGRYLPALDNLVYIGAALLSLGMLTGAVWAKQAWGDFWTWDPKETWAAATWCVYLLYIHLRLARPAARARYLYAVAVAGFLLLQMCWWGYQYLPASRNSLHIYGS